MDHNNNCIWYIYIYTSNISFLSSCNFTVWPFQHFFLQRSPPPPAPAKWLHLACATWRAEVSGLAVQRASSKYPTSPTKRPLAGCPGGLETRCLCHRWCPKVGVGLEPQARVFTHTSLVNVDTTSKRITSGWAHSECARKIGFCINSCTFKICILSI